MWSTILGVFKGFIPGLSFKTIMIISLLASIAGGGYYIKHKFKKLDQAKVEIIQLKEQNKKLKKKGLFQFKIYQNRIDEIETDFVKYRENYKIKLVSDKKTNKALKINKKYNYQNIFNKIKSYETSN